MIDVWDCFTDALLGQLGRDIRALRRLLPTLEANGTPASVLTRIRDRIAELEPPEQERFP